MTYHTGSSTNFKHHLVSDVTVVKGRMESGLQKRSIFSPVSDTPEQVDFSEAAAEVTYRKKQADNTKAE